MDDSAIMRIRRHQLSALSPNSEFPGGLGALGVLNAGFAATHDGTPGHAATFTSVGVSVAGVNTTALGVLPAEGSNFIRAIPGVGLFVSGIGTVSDLFGAGKDLADCLNGK